MADTIPAIEVGATWVNLNTVSGISAGTSVILQNVGHSNDIIDLVISASEPPQDFEGIELFQNAFFGVDAGENPVWAKYKRADRSDVGTKVTKIQVQA